MLTSVYIKKPGNAASIPGNMRISFTQNLAGWASSADRQARIDGAIPEYTANMPSTLRYAFYPS